ncbi:hypothetical protein [Streptomyces sp. NPDC058657]|uniref:hypothetical protein n=1 Tax=unclassified Streptomyces TaxID=2593676 RepID=UPI003662AC60
MRDRLFNKVRLAVTGSLAAGAIVALTAAPASAWTGGNVWVNFGSWNCPNAKVVGVYWAVDGYSAGPAGGDWGDNVIYPRVRVGSRAYNTLSYQIKCQKWGWFNYNGPVGSKYLTPYKSGLSYTY